MSPIVLERLSYIKPGENVWNANLPEHLKLKDTNTKLSQIYKRLDPNKPSYTITGSGGGGTHGYHYKENRALTNRERARIQTFPDDFSFVGSIESVRKQIGMAVPPKLSEVIFKHIVYTLADKSYDAIEPNIKLD
jgi:DNA (cytosine-5)-methyltransferase 1